LAENDAQGEWALPDGWVWTTIGEITQPIEKVKPRENPDASFTYLDISSIDNQSNRIAEPKVYYGAEAPSRARQLVQANDVLFSTVRTYLKNIALVPEAYDGQIASTGFSVLRSEPGVSSKYLFYYALTDPFLNKLGKLQRGTSYPAVRDGDVRAQLVPLAPLPEQHRIVAEIETQFTRLDAAVAGLERAQANIRRYKAAVLQVACEGHLVPTEAELARVEGRAYEPADQLLACILAERRARWEADYLEKQRAKGKEPKNDRWKRKYREPTLPDVEDLPELPEGWVWATVEQLASSEPRSIQSGPFGSTLLHSEFQDSGVLAIGIDNVLEGQFSMGKQHRISPEKYEQLKKYTARPLDVLITVMATVGRCCVVPANLETAIVTKHVYRISANQGFVNPFYLMFALWGGHEVRRQLFGSVRGQTRPGINGKILRQIAIPIPPLPEQRRIVAEVDRRLSLVAALEASVEAALARAGRLRQAVLKRAFEGRLVPQDPDDEPASVLLERIRAQRKVEWKGKKTINKKQQPQQLELL
jgi:type I restriction enzyme S subunit